MYMCGGGHPNDAAMASSPNKNYVFRRSNTCNKLEDYFTNTSQSVSFGECQHLHTYIHTYDRHNVGEEDGQCKMRASTE
jgi:hypothetical protein